ncbi:MAG: hypothetical protein K0R39_931 [Symbiobacteriaceae bacterium]|nr:hypothetical protein [Symbiobacteriaceae bacterium]
MRAREALRAQQALAEAQRASGDAARALDQVRAERAEFNGDLAVRRARGMAAWEWSVTSRRLDDFRLAELAAIEALRLARELEAERRLTLNAAKQREESLNQLEQRQREAYLYLALQEEQVLTDELAQSMRLTRKKGDLA